MSHILVISWILIIWDKPTGMNANVICAKSAEIQYDSNLECGIGKIKTYQKWNGDGGFPAGFAVFESLEVKNEPR